VAAAERLIDIELKEGVLSDVAMKGIIEAVKRLTNPAKLADIARSGPIGYWKEEVNYYGGLGVDNETDSSLSYILAAPSEGMRAYALEFKGLYYSLQGKVELGLSAFERAADLYRSIQNYSYFCSKFKQLEWISYDWGKNDLYRKYVQAFYENRNQYGIRPEPLNKTSSPDHHHSEESAL
jgi:hypothetical protein